MDCDVEPTLTNFIAKLPQRLQNIVCAVKSGNKNQAEQAAYTLKGIAVAFGTEKLAKLCQELERLGKAGQIPSDGRLLATILDEAEQVKKEVMDIL
jgi:HPt (histidine-containing phosphotransfer) domain-containing protein